jgi:hypothetical protein
MTTNMTPVKKVPILSVSLSIEKRRKNINIQTYIYTNSHKLAVCYCCACVTAASTGSGQIEGSTPLPHVSPTSPVSPRGEEAREGLYLQKSQIS